jgi:hypothetical protein
MRVLFSIRAKQTKEKEKEREKKEPTVNQKLKVVSEASTKFLFRRPFPKNTILCLGLEEGYILKRKLHGEANEQV